MKKQITIGRGYDNNIVIEDDTGKVSRRQAVVQYSFFGKPKIYDLSSNGTFVNGEPVPRPEGIELNKHDKVKFGPTYEFDLSRLRNPYAKTWGVAIACFSCLIICCVIFWFVALRENIDTDNQQTVSETENAQAMPDNDMENVNDNENFEGSLPQTEETTFESESQNISGTKNVKPVSRNNTMSPQKDTKKNTSIKPESKTSEPTTNPENKIKPIENQQKNSVSQEDINEKI